MVRCVRCYEIVSINKARDLVSREPIIVSKRSVNFSIAFGLSDLPLFEADIQYPVPTKMRELSRTFCDAIR